MSAVAEELNNEVAAQSSEIQGAAKNSLDFLAALAMPTIFTFLYPTIFKAVWKWLLEHTLTPRAFPQLALGLPRGFGKTTFIKIYILYCILFTSKKFILVICSTATLAENILADVVDMLNEPNIKKVFGDWKAGIEKDTQSTKKFGFRGRNIILAGLGAGTSLRGLNIKNERPDVMIFEDIQTRECADSEVQSDALLRWMIGTAMKAKSPSGCIFIFVGNMYPTKHSILKKLKHNSSWIKFITGGILADGTSLWEELQPVEQLMQEFSNDLEMGHPEIFYSEVLNDEEAIANNLIDISAIPPYPFDDADIPSYRFVVIDPAGNKESADNTTVAYFEGHDVPVLRHLTEGIMSPGETIRVALNYCLLTGCSLIAVEGVAYQASLKYWFDVTMAQLSLTGIEAVSIHPGAGSKNSRIIDMLRGYAKGEILIHPSCRPAAHTQMAQFNPLRKNNTDGILDVLWYAPKIIDTYGAYIISTNVINSQDFNSVTITDELETSEF